MTRNRPELQLEIDTVVNKSSLLEKTLFITGGTGFVGGWLLAAIQRLNSNSKRKLRVRALARKPQQYVAPWLTWVYGDICNFEDNFRPDLIFHAALPTTQIRQDESDNLTDNAHEGAARVIRHAKKYDTERVFLTSSGAVYGELSKPAVESIEPEKLRPEDNYGKLKLEVEARFKSELSGKVDLCIGRLFTFIGEGYRDHNHLAHVGLVEDARRRRPLVLNTNGSAIRSYLAGEDLGVWLLSLISKTGNDTVNIGSADEFSIKQFAELVLTLSNRSPSELALNKIEPRIRKYYVPDTTRAREKYGLKEWTKLEEVIKRLIL